MKQHNGFPKLFTICASLLFFIAMQHVIDTDSSSVLTVANLDSMRDRILCANIEYVVGTVVAQQENPFGANGFLPVAEALEGTHATSTTNNTASTNSSKTAASDSAATKNKTSANTATDNSAAANPSVAENALVKNRPNTTTSPNRSYLYQTKHCQYDYDALTTTSSLRALLANRSSGISDNKLPPSLSVSTLTNPSQLLTHHGAGILLLSLLNHTDILPFFSSQLGVLTIVFQAICSLILACAIGWIYREISRVAGCVLLVCTLLSPVVLYASAQLVVPLAALLLPITTLSWLLYYHKRDLLTNTNWVWIVHSIATFISILFAGYSFMLPVVCTAFAPLLYYCCIKKQPFAITTKDIGAFTIASASAVVVSILVLAAQAWVAHRAFSGVVQLFRHLLDTVAVASFAASPQLPQSLAVSHVIPLTQVLTRYGMQPALIGTLHFPFIPITITYLQLCIVFAVLCSATLIIQNVYGHGCHLTRYRPLLQYKLFVLGITACYALMVPLITIAIIPAFSWRALPHGLIQWHIAAVPFCISFIVYFCMRLVMSWLNK